MRATLQPGANGRAQHSAGPAAGGRALRPRQAWARSAGLLSGPLSGGVAQGVRRPGPPGPDGVPPGPRLSRGRLSLACGLARPRPRHGGDAGRGRPRGRSAGAVRPVHPSVRAGGWRQAAPWRWLGRCGPAEADSGRSVSQFPARTPPAAPWSAAQLPGLPAGGRPPHRLPPEPDGTPAPWRSGPTRGLRGVPGDTGGGSKRSPGRPRGPPASEAWADPGPRDPVRRAPPGEGCHPASGRPRGAVRGWLFPITCCLLGAVVRGEGPAPSGSY